MDRQPSFLFKSKSYARMVFGISFALIGFAFSQSAPAQNSPPPVALELNKPIEREIAGGQKQSYQLSLSANQYLSATIEQRGIDVIARLYGADGKLLLSYDAEARLNGTEKIEFVAPVEGVYRFDVEPVYKLLPAGKYEINLTELRAATEQEKSLQEAANLYAESVRLYNAGKYEEASKPIEQSLEIRRKELGEENNLTATALTQQARILDDLGKLDEAEKSFLKVLTVREKILGAEHPDVAATLNFLALAYSDDSNFQQSLVYQQRALQIREKVFGQTHPAVAVSLINLGIVYDALGDKVKALDLYKRALNIQEQTVGTENFNFAVVLNNIGKISNDLDEYEKAEPYIVRAIAILEKLYAPDHPRTLEPLFNLAISLVGQSKLDKAETLYLRLMSSYEKLLGPNHPRLAQAAYNLGNLYTLEKNFAKAEPLYRRALTIDENALGADNPRVSGDLSALALLLGERGDIEQAVNLQQRADAIDELNISLNMATGSERQKLAYLDNIFEQTNQSIFLQAQYAKDNPLAVELAATTVLRQKGRVLDAVSNNLIELRRRLNPQDQTLLDNLNKVNKEASELILNGPDDDDIAAHSSKIKTLVDEREKLEDEISRRAAGFFVKSAPITVPAIQAVIPSDSALVEFAVYYTNTLEASVKSTKTAGEAHYVVYVLHNRGKVEWTDLGDAQQINTSIGEYRQALRDPKRTDIQTIARALDEKIMQPVRALLGDSKQLFISPDGELNLIPFEALVDEKSHYLIENYSFTYLTSGRDLLRLQTARTSKSNPLVIANPLFGETDSGQIAANNKRTVRKNKRRSVLATRDLSDTYFTPLSGTAQEARSIQSIFPEAAVLTGDKATKLALKQASAPKILHIATHGFFLEKDEIAADKSITNARIENPLLRSGLALAGANQHEDNKDDGILTALEASGLNLWGTKLVVLSACDTGVGEVKNGEGVYGLRRAFILAGTETLVMSLWSVSDFVTRELMTNYYKNLKQGMGRGAALRQVQLEMLKRKGREHPFYWAAFIQSGEWANLDGKR